METARRQITLDLKDQLAFYGAYHANVYNQLIHFIFVPVILFSVAVWLSYTPTAIDISASVDHPYVALNGAFFLIYLPYSVFYILLDPIAGISWATFVGLPVWIGAAYLQQTYPSDAWLWAIYAHVLGWFMQIVPGHGYFEKRKPSLMDSFVQSLLLAPLFVWFELLFWCGYRKDLYEQVSASVQRDVTAAREAGRRLLEHAEDEE